MFLVFTIQNCSVNVVIRQQRVAVLLPTRCECVFRILIGARHTFGRFITISLNLAEVQQNSIRLTKMSTVYIFVFIVMYITTYYTILSSFFIPV